MYIREIEIQHRKNKKEKENRRAIEIWEKMLGCKSFFPLANAKHKKGRGVKFQEVFRQEGKKGTL